jgi:hypothetical protein
MSSNSWLLKSEAPAGRDARELPGDYRERLVREERERAEKRRLELADQRSSLNPPEMRIRTWEKLHALRLPTDPNHPILDVIAIATRLTLAEVQEEQRRRESQSPDSRQIVGNSAE